MKMVSNDEELSTSSFHHGESKRTSCSSSINADVGRHQTTMKETSRIKAADFESSSSASVHMHANNRIQMRQQRKRTLPRKAATTAKNSGKARGLGASFWVVLLLLGMGGRHTQLNGNSLFVGAALPGDKKTIHASRMLRSSTAITGVVNFHDMGTGGVTDNGDDDKSPILRMIERQRISKKNRSLQDRPEENDVEPAPFSPSTRRPSQRPTTAKPTSRPTLQPSAKPTDRPTARPTDRPTAKPTNRPTRSPTLRPTGGPTPRPTRPPTPRPTGGPTPRPTRPPTPRPTGAPTAPPTRQPTARPSRVPTRRPTVEPTNRPTVPPTVPPTMQPTTAFPTPATVLPTQRRTQISQFTRPPSNLPTFFDFLTRRPTSAPTRAPTPQPTPAPTRPPTRAPTKPPTRAPNQQPTRPPTKPPTRTPTRRPTQRPTLIPTTARPTNLPTALPSKGNSKKSSRPAQLPTQAPTVPLPVTEQLPLPIDFTADVVLPETVVSNDTASVNVFAARVAGIWERYLGAVLQEQADLEEFVSWIGIDLTVVPGAVPNATNVDGSTTRRLALQLRRRWLQDNVDGGNLTSSIRLTTSGAAAFIIEPKQVNSKKFLQRMQQILGNALTMEQLQAALTNGGNAATVSAVARTQEDENNGSTDKPSLADIIIGFTIVVIAMATLVFWGVVLHRKREKKRKKRARMTAMSQSKARMAMSPSPSRPPLPQMPMTIAATSSDGSKSSYKGVGSGDEGDAASDPFGRELEQAASLDQAAWEDFQRQKQAMDEGQRVYASSPGRSVYNTVGIASSPYRANSGRTNSSQEQGVEVDAGGIPRTSSFPYGDEGDPEMPSNPPGVQRQAITLTADDAVSWTATGIALNVTGMAKKKYNGYEGAKEEEDKGWNPYKDSPERSGLASSRGTTPARSPTRQAPDSEILSVRRPGYGSSPYREAPGPLSYGTSPDREASRPVSYGTSPDRNDARPLSYGKSPDRKANGESFATTLKEEKPSQYSFLYPLMKQDPSPVNDRASPTDSSADTAAAGAGSSPTSWSTFMGLGRASPPPVDDSENDNPDDDMTDEMVKEVDELAQFVKQYEKKKETRKQKDKERSMRMETTSELRSIPVGQQGVVSGNRNKQDPPAASTLHTEREAQRSENRTIPAPSDRSAVKPPDRRSEESQPTSAKKDRGVRGSIAANDSSQRSLERSDREMQPTENGSSKKAVELPASEFFLPKTKDVDVTLSSDELMYLPVVPGSFESSDASDFESEAEDDTSQRLGISRFSVQKPLAPLLSFKADPEEQKRDDPPVPSSVQPSSRARHEKSPAVLRPSTGARQENSPSVLRQYQPSEPPLAENEAHFSEESPLEGMEALQGYVEEKKEADRRTRAMQGSPIGRPEAKKRATHRVRPDGNTPKTKGSKQKGALSSLRGNKAMLDGHVEEEADSSSPVAPYDEVKEPTPPSQIPRTRTAGLTSPLNMSPLVGTRSKNKGFNSIMTMFESKPKNAVTPPSDSWQYNS